MIGQWENECISRSVLFVAAAENFKGFILILGRSHALGEEMGATKSSQAL